VAVPDSRDTFHLHMDVPVYFHRVVCVIWDSYCIDRFSSILSHEEVQTEYCRLTRKKYIS
jgi:hypothetical protein